VSPTSPHPCLLHGTPIKNLASILKDGLRPEFAEGRPLVYLTSDKHYAMCMAWNSGPAILIGIDPTRLPLEEFPCPGFYVLDEFICRSVIGADHILGWVDIGART
jgi:hypothetical protein